MSQTQANPRSFVNLNVLFLASSVNRKFDTRPLSGLPRVDVEDGMRIDDLRFGVSELVKKAFKFKVDPQTLKFYKFKSKVFAQDVLGLTEEPKDSDMVQLPSVTRLRSAFDVNSIGEGTIDLIVRGTELVVDVQDEEVESVRSLPIDGPYKRYAAFADSVRKMQSSCQAAKSEERVVLQKRTNTVVYDGMFAPDIDGAPMVETIAPPIELFYPPFGTLAKTLEDPLVKPDADTLIAVSKLASYAGVIATEQVYTERLREDIVQVLCNYIAQVSMSIDCRPYGIVFEVMERFLVPLLVIELKGTLGKGGCDPLVQAEYSVLKRWDEKKLKVLREKCCCPTLVLAGWGPNLALLGVVWTDRFIVQRITDIVFIAQATTSPDEQIYRLARLFTAIRTSLKDLVGYYECINAQATIPLQRNTPHPRFFPHITRFLSRETNGFIKFRYISAINDGDPTNVIFRVETEEEELVRPLIVKFTDRYGYAAHQYLANSGFAPKLFYYGLLDGETDVLSSGSDMVTGRIRSDAGGLYTGPMHMVVMEYLDGKNAAQIPDAEWPSDAFGKVKAAVDKLHDGGFVFGDLRRPNVMFTRHEQDWHVYFVDFDWSGLEGEVYYPPGLSERPIWAKGVVSFQKIEKEHDLEMLEMHFLLHRTPS